MRLLIISILVLLYTDTYSQTHTLSGYITDVSNGENIFGANIIVDSLSVGTTSNNFGFYSITLPTGNHTISYSYIGYSSQMLNINLKSDISNNIEFTNTASELNEVKLFGEKSIVEKTETSVIDLPIKQVFKIPALLGEVDVLKAIQLLPGVQSSEGTSGFYVRGGGPDQNLILLDGVPVYNAAHLGGLFSIFNPDAIKNIRLTKGGFPARFGGRLSSVLEIDMKEGNMKKLKSDITIGLISSKFTFEGPIIKDRTSFIISARRTYADLIVRPFIPENTNLNMYFYDLNMKINHKISNKDRIFLSSYLGRDQFGVDYEENENDYSDALKFGLGYGNITSTLRWNHLFNNKLFSNTTLTYSRYAFDTDFGVNSTTNTLTGNEIYDIGFGYISGIKDYAGRIDFDYSPNPIHNLKFGYSYTYHHFFPGETSLNLNFSTPDSLANFTLDTLLNFSERINAQEMFAYLEDNVKITDRLKANIGIHCGYYSLDKFSLQPRFSARYLLNENASIKLSYADMKQNIHLLSNSSVGFPSDLWLPAIDSVPSQSSKQIAASVNTILEGFDFLHPILNENSKLELSIEAYYKTMSNLITYKAGYSNLESTESWENSIETGGKGESYGLELFLQKKTGRTTGWIGYTLSWTNRQFENINFGQWYPYKYDRRHDFALVFSHKINEKWDISTTWTYGTGNAITFPQAMYLGQPYSEWGNNNMIDLVESYGERNSTRLNAYHRLDIGLTHHKQKKYYERIISFGAYNAYNRKNPFFAYLSHDENGNRVAKQVSLFPIIPSISLRYKL
tara:strand:- start:14238 stop:16616 length:2379 start_codon:yes stop_codon:yes gene_type:complete